MQGAHLEVHVPKLGNVSANDLVGIHENNFAQGEREQHVQEQDLIGPDDALLLRLSQTAARRNILSAGRGA